MNDQSQQVEPIPPALKSAINVLAPFVIFGVSLILLTLLAFSLSIWIESIEQYAFWISLPASIAISIAVTIWQDKLKGTVRQHVQVLFSLILLLIILVLILLPAFTT